MALIGYARVSILEEESWLQHDALEAAGCKRVFTDRASGAAEERPELARLFDHLREGDTLVVTRLDRIGRSLRDLIDTVGTLAERDVGLRSLDGTLDTTGAKGKAVVAICAALAEFELDILRERTALAAVGVREPREPRLGSLVEAARNLPIRRAAAETSETPQVEPPPASVLEEATAPVRPSPRGSGVVVRSRRRATAPSTEPAEPAEPRRRRRRVLLALQILAVAGAAFAALQVAQSGARSGGIVLTHTVSNDDVALGAPEGWRRSSPDLAVASLGLREPIVLRQGPLGGAMIMAGMSYARGATLLSEAMTGRLAGVPRATTVRLARMTALRYTDLRVADLTRRMTVFAVPTSAGVLTLACLSPPGGAAALRPVCDGVARSMRLTRARALAPGPSPRYQIQLNALVEALDLARAEQRAKLAAAEDPVQQARGAERLADAFAQARATGVEQRVSPREAAAHARIVAAIGATREAYARMADAARAAHLGDYERARVKVGIGERRVRAALNALTALGYEITPTASSGGS